MCLYIVCQRSINPDGEFIQELPLLFRKSSSIRSLDVVGVQDVFRRESANRIILVCKYAVVLVEDNLWEEEHEVILPLSRAIGVMVVTDVFNFDLAIRQEYMTFREDVANNLLVIRIFLNKYLH